MSEISWSEGYEELTHTADLALRLWAPDLNRLLVQAALGMYALCEVTQLSGDLIQLPLNLAASEPEDLLVTFLSELLYLLQDKCLVIEAFDFQIAGCCLSGFLGARLSAQPLREIKAVTYHNLVVGFTREGCTATVVFDV